MKSLKNTILPIIIGLVLFSINFTVVMADVTYTYKGKKFTVVRGNYTTSQKITGSFTLPMRLPLNGSYTIEKLPVFSFSDGINKLNDRNVSHEMIMLETDSNSIGNIKSWYLSFTQYEPNPPRIMGKVRGISTLSGELDLGFIGICYGVTGDYCTKFSNQPEMYPWMNFGSFLRQGSDYITGTWKITNDNTSSSPLTGILISTNFGDHSKIITNLQQSNTHWEELA